MQCRINNELNQFISVGGGHIEFLQRQGEGTEKIKCEDGQLDFLKLSVQIYHTPLPPPNKYVAYAYVLSFKATVITFSPLILL